jgi:hypothetical protein
MSARCNFSSAGGAEPRPQPLQAPANGTSRAGRQVALGAVGGLKVIIEPKGDHRFAVITRKFSCVFVVRKNFLRFAVRKKRPNLAAES